MRCLEYALFKIVAFKINAVILLASQKLNVVIKAPSLMKAWPESLKAINYIEQAKS